MSSGVQAISSDPLGALSNQYNRPIFIPGNRIPTTNDVQPPGTEWQNGTGGLIYQTTGNGVWATSNSAASNINTLTGDSGGALSPSANNINILGTANQITTTGSGSTLTLSLASSLTVPGSLTVTSGFTVSAGAVAITSGTSAINISADAAATTVNLATGSAAKTVTIGSTNSTSSLTLAAGTGNFSITGATTTTFSIGLATGTGAISLGISTAAETINISSAASNTGAQIVNILNGATPGASTTLNIMDGAGTAGTQTFNLLASGATRAGVVNISTGAAAHITTIGSSTTGNLISLAAPITSLPGPVYVYTGAGAPSAGLAVHVGDLYINTTAASATTRMYIATAASTWTNVTCAG